MHMENDNYVAREEHDHHDSDWLGIEESVALCAEHGLTRTPKTLRKWAARSFGRADGDVIANRQDTPSGNYRWLIDRQSLMRKIEQELELQKTLASEEPEAAHVGVVQTGADPFEPGEPTEVGQGAIPDTPAPDEQPDVAPVASVDDDFYKKQLEQKDHQIEQLNQQMERKDKQIMTMLERDRETNVLLKHLNDTVNRTLGLEAPGASRGYPSHAGSEPQGVAHDNEENLFSDAQNQVPVHTHEHPASASEEGRGV